MSVVLSLLWPLHATDILYVSDKGIRSTEEIKKFVAATGLYIPKSSGANFAHSFIYV